MGNALPEKQFNTRMNQSIKLRTCCVESWFPNISDGQTFGVGEDERQHFVGVCVKECFDLGEVVNDFASVKKDLQSTFHQYPEYRGRELHRTQSTKTGKHPQ